MVDYLESIGSSFGADLNAGAGFDDTLYFLGIPAEDPKVTEITGAAFQIPNGWACAISCGPDEVELERGSVLEK